MLSFHKFSLTASVRWFLSLCGIGFVHLFSRGLVRLEEAHHILPGREGDWQGDDRSGGIPVLAGRSVLYNYTGLLWHNNSINRFEIVLYKWGLDIKPKRNNADNKKQDYIYIIYDIPCRQSWHTPILAMILWYIYLCFSALQKRLCVLWCAHPVVLLGWSTLENGVAWSDKFISDLVIQHSQLAKIWHFKS